MKWQFELKDQARRPTLSIRMIISVTELPTVIGPTLMKIYNYLVGLGEQPTEVPFTAYHNMDMAHLDVEIGFPVSRGWPDSGEIEAGEIAAGQVVSCLYKGLYSGMEPMYADLRQWIEQNNLEPTGIYYEYYLNSPQDVPESELLTRVEWPVRERA